MVLQTQFAQIRDRSLYIDDVNAMDLVKKYGTPLYVMSEGHIRHQFEELKTKFLSMIMFCHYLLQSHLVV